MTTLDEDACLQNNNDYICILEQVGLKKNDPDNVTSDTVHGLSCQNLHIQDVSFQEDPTAVEIHST